MENASNIVSILFGLFRMSRRYCIMYCGGLFFMVFFTIVDDFHIWSAVSLLGMISKQLLGIDTAIQSEITLVYQTTNIFFTNLIAVYVRFSSYWQELSLELANFPQAWQQWVSPDARNLLNAMVLGDAEQLSSTVQHQFKVIGMQHVMAASGFNISLMLGIAQRMIGRFLPSTARLIFFLLVVWCYGIMINWPASLVRASVMSNWQLIARWGVGRPISPVTALGLTFFTTLALWPSLFTSVGWQLSFVATASLALTAHQHSGALSQLLIDPTAQPPASSVWQNVRDALWTGGVVQLATLPLLWHHFQTWSWVGLIANALLVWVTPWLTSTAVYLMLLERVSVQLHVPSWFGVITAFVGVIVGWVGDVFLWSVATIAATFPRAIVTLPGIPSFRAVVGSWVGMIFALYAYKYQSKRGENGFE